MSIETKSFGRLPDGTEVNLYTLRNKSGMEVSITDYGCIVVTCRVPDRKGLFEDVVLGYDAIEGYFGGSSYFGAIIGRFGNRIHAGSFPLDGTVVTLPVNDPPNHLHGGVRGFDKQVWNARIIDDQEEPSIVFSRVSPNGEEGYPGALAIEAVHTLTAGNGLRIDVAADADRTTLVNITHHSYFNLRGAGDPTILDHKVMLHADRFTPLGENSVPTGEIREVEGTPFDFREPRTVGDRIGDDDEQLRRGRGYDHNWVLSGVAGQLRPAARVDEHQSGRAMEVWTTEPGIQFYTSNFLDGTEIGKGGTPYTHRSALCLEPQGFPDSPNHVEFPQAVLGPGETYRHTMEYRFSVVNPA